MTEHARGGQNENCMSVDDHSMEGQVVFKYDNTWWKVYAGGHSLKGHYRATNAQE